MLEQAGKTGGAAASEKSPDKDGKTPGKETPAVEKKATPSVDGISIDTLQAFITAHEGVVYHTYSDSRGFPTAGIGHLMPPGTKLNQPVSHEQVAEWFKSDVATAINGAKKVMGSHFDKLNAARKCVIIDMVFNLGEAGFAGFTNTIQNIEAGNWAAAASGMLASLWASQVGHRATQDAQIMKSGDLSGASAGGGGDSKEPEPTKGGGKEPKKGGGEVATASEKKELGPVLEGKDYLRQGSHGAQVVAVQKLLGITADGDFGPITEASVKHFQSTHGLTVDGIVGPETAQKLEGDGGGGGGGSKPTPKKPAPKPSKGGKPPAKPSGGSPISIASKFVGDDSWSSVLRDDIKGYNNEGRVTNNCAEFVSSCLFAAGWISSHPSTDDNVGDLQTHLLGSGWKIVSQQESVVNDVWMHHGNPDHTVLIAQNGHGINYASQSTIGSDGSATEVIKHEAMPYAGATYLHRA